MAKRGSKPGNGPDSHAGNGKSVVLAFDPHNANTHSDASLGAVRRSVDRLGAGRSVVADASGTLIAGEATLRAAQDLGVPVRIVETDGSELVAVVRTDIGPDDPRRHALAIADNQTARLSEFDPERLEDSLRGLGDYDDLLEATGFDADAIAEMLTPDIDEPADAEPQTDRAAELAKQWGTAAGQLWLLGEHRLLCVLQRFKDAFPDAEIKRATP
jgi:ParB-like chromosome segregation protein Spo0J